MHFSTRLNRDFRTDLLWWHTFLQSWSGLSILRHSSLSFTPDFVAYTDASGMWGCAAVLGSQWLQWQWPKEWSNVGIMAKELIPILFTSIVWGAQLSRLHINFQCDNETLVIAINKGSSKDKLVMHLLWRLWFFATHFDIQITATHLPGALNVTADYLSRNNLTQAFLATPTAPNQCTSTSIHSCLTQTVGLDFPQVFQPISANFIINLI